MSPPGASAGSSQTGPTCSSSRRSCRPRPVASSMTRGLEWRARGFRAEDLDGAWLVHTATGDQRVDDDVAAACEDAPHPVRQRGRRHARHRPAGGGDALRRQHRRRRLRRGRRPRAHPRAPRRDRRAAARGQASAAPPPRHLGRPGAPRRRRARSHRPHDRPRPPPARRGRRRRDRSPRPDGRARRARPRRRDRRRRQAPRPPPGAAGRDQPHHRRPGARRASASCASRAATPSSTAAAAKRCTRAWPPASRSTSFPASRASIAVPQAAGIPVTHRGTAAALHVVNGQDVADRGDPRIAPRSRDARPSC